MLALFGRDPVSFGRVPRIAVAPLRPAASDHEHDQRHERKSADATEFQSGGSRASSRLPLSW